MSASKKRPVAGSRSPARPNTSADAARWTRIGLLGSTALIAASLAVSPAFAQTTIASPAGGGAIIRTGGSATTNDQTGAGGGVQISNVTQSAQISVNGVTINNTTGSPTTDALRILGSTSGLNSTGVTLTGVNTLTTTTDGGAALYVSTNANMGIGITSSGSTFTGSYGINLLAVAGYVSFDASNQSQSFVANGTHIAGFNAVTGVNASIQLGSSTITGFDTGINSSNFYGSFVEMTGGSISALVTGIRTDATGGRSNIQSQAAIVAPTGIHSTNTDGADVTTSGAGTINAVSAGNGTGIIATSSGGTNNVNVTVGAAIGGTTRFATGVDASATGGTGIVNVTTTAAINAGTGVSMSSGSGATANVQGAITASTGISSTALGGGVTNITTSGAGTLNALTANSGTGISATTSGSGALNVTVGAAIGGSSAFGTGVLLTTTNPSTAVINFHNTAAITASTANSVNSGLQISMWLPSGRSTIDIGADITGGRGVYSMGGVYDFTVQSGATITAAAVNGHGINSGNSGSTLVNAGTIRATGAGGHGADMAGIGSITNSGTIEGAARGISLLNTTTINNTGFITGGTAGGIQGTGATVNNTGGTISGNTGISANGNPANITNSAGGVITGVVDGINLSSNVSGTLTNSAAISANTAAGVYLSRTSALTYQIVNTGTITGGSNASLGYAINVEDGATTITNNSGGQINGVDGLASGRAIRLISDDQATLNLNAGSTVNGGILSTGAGNRTLSLAGSVTGAYDASGGTGVDSFTLTAAGSIGGAVSLGAGDDTFNWNGGTIGSTINGGTGAADAFNSVLGIGGSGSLNLSNLSNFDTYSHLSGTLTLTGSRNGGAVWNTGATTTLDLSGSLTNTTGTGFGVTAAAGATVNVLGTGVLDNWVSLYFNGGGTSTATNSGSITGQSTAIFSTSGRVNFTNNVGATVTSTGASANTAIALASGGGTIINNGTISANTAGAGLSSSNTGAGGSASSLTTGAGSLLSGITAGLSMTGSGAFGVTNAGTISGTAASGNGIQQSAGTVTIANNSGGALTGLGYGVNVTGGALALTNASGATLSGGTGALQAATTGTATIDLQAGSTTTGDMILSGTGARTLTVAGGFSGNLDASGNSGAVNLTLNTSATGYTLLQGGSGADSLTFTGAGSRTFSVDNLTSWDTGSFTGGAWTLTGTGNATSFVSGLTVNGAALTISNTQQLQGATGVTLTGGGSITTTASLSNTRTLAMTGAGSLGAASGQTLTQSGVVSGSGVLTLNGPGTLVLSGNNTYTGGTVVNSGILQLGHTSGAGTGVIRMIDPQINFAATGTYNNDISLEVVDGQQAADPTILNNTSGGAITLAGRIYETASIGGAGQYVTFNGGAISLTNNTNSWAGVSRINSGVTLTGTTGSISGASIVNNGTLTYVNTTAGTASQAISGSGAININGTGATTLAGAITTTGQLTVSGAGARLIIGGARTGSSNTGVVVSGAGASLTVADGASIQSGQYNGVRLNGTNTTLTNLGLIQNAGTGGDGAVGAGVFVIDAAGTTTTINNGSVSDTGAGSTIRGYNAGIRHDNSALGTLVVNNYGRVLGDVYNGIENTNGLLTLNNFAGGEIYTLVGNGVSSASAGAVTVTNAGVIGRDIANTQTVGGYGVVTSGPLTLVNQAGGLITGSLGGVSAASSASITNAGSITGAGAGSYGLSMTAGGSVTNQSGGSITGTSGGMLLSGATAFTLNLQAGSTTGLVRSTASGTVTTTVAGSLTGAYVATGTGVDNLTLASTGSMTGASLGAGADSFTYLGGAFSGLIDAGTGTDSFTSNLGSGSASVSLNLLANFETIAHQSGTLTLTGVGIATGGLAIEGGTLVMDGILPYAASVASGATLRGSGRLGAVTVADGGFLAGSQGTTLTMGSLDLSSGSTINATFSGAGGPALFAVTGDLTLDGTVNVASTGAYGFGVYGLMTYGGVLTDNGLVIGTTPGGAQRVAVQTSVAGQINIVHAPTELLFWDGGPGGHDNGAVNGGAGTWTAAGSEWTDSSGLFNGAMQPQPGFAIFQGVGGVVTVANSAGAVGVTGMQFAADGYRIQGDSITLADASTRIRVGDGTAPSAAWTATIASALTGAGGLVKTDLGTLILGGENTYSGGTTINAGTLQIGDGAAAGSILGSVVLANDSTLVFSRNDNHAFANAVSGAGSVGVNGIVTLSGAITATGGLDVYGNSEATVSNVSVNTGPAVSLGSNGRVNVAAGGTVFASSGNAINGQGTGTVTNLGTIQATTTAAIFLNGANSSVTNSGSVIGASTTAAVQFGNVGLLANMAGGSISNIGGAVLAIGAGSQVLNEGTIASSNSGTTISFAAGGNLTNRVTGVITGAGASNMAVYFGGANSRVDNAGQISSTNTGVYFALGGGSVGNTGSISGANYGIRANVDSPIAVTNSGSITSDAIGIGANGVLTLTNAAGGTITGTNFYGFFASGAFSTISNAGLISGGNVGAYLNGASNSLTNTGTIRSGGGANHSIASGVYASAANATVTNSGVIENIHDGGFGVRFANGGSLINQSGGSISGLNAAGVLLTGANNYALDLQQGSSVLGGIDASATTGTNTVDLAGVLGGGYLGGSGVDTFNLYATGTFSGGIDGGAGVDAFALTGAGGGSLDIGAVTGFESRAMNGSGVRTLTGTDTSTVAWDLNSGTLAVSGGAAINDAVAINIAAPGALQLNASERIGALNGSGFVALGTSTLTVGGAGASNYAGVIGGSGGVTVTGGGVLTLSGANTYTGATTASGATLRLGASNVLADTTNLTASFGGVVDMGTFSDTVATSTFFTGTRLDGTGTLTAGSYTSYGAAINANLGAGTLNAIAGTTTLNGTAGAGQVFVNGGALSLGASNRLADTATVSVSSGSRLELNAFNETVGVLTLNGLLNGTGTLTAAQYALNGGTVNANLGSGALFSIGSSTLNGTASAGQVSVDGGTLTLGSSNRLADGAAVTVASGATLALGGFTDTVGTIDLAGVLAGTGALTAGTYTLSGGVVNANLGAGLLIQQSGVSSLNGMSGAGQVSVNAGTLGLGAANRLADTATVSVASGSTLNLNAFDDTVGLALLNGTLAGSGTLTAGEYALNGATINANLGAGNLFNVGGVSILTGSTAAANVIVQAGTLALGASDRLADAATVSVASGSSLNLNGFDDIVGLALLNGTLAGTGTLTAGEYDLNGATINANLGAGNLFNVGGVSTLTGTSGASGVVVQAGTLTLGASNRLADTATVSVASGSTLDLGAFNDTVGLAVLNGTLAGTGTLTAAQYQLNAAVVNANLGAGVLFNLGGGSILTGTAAANQVSIDAGTLRLGASERLSDAAMVWVATAATFNVNGFNERIGALFGTGDVNVGAGRLTFGGVESGFGGRLSGTGSVVHTGGLFTLMGDHTIASISNTGGELRFLGTTTGGLSASGGSVTGAGTIGGALTASNGAVLSPGLAGVQNGIGGFTAGGLTLNGGTLAIDVLGKSGGNLIDQLRINGAATLTGGLLAPTFQGSAATDFDFSTRYLFLQANTLVGTFANGGTFTAAGPENLFWRVRYDLSPNGAVLELRELTGFDPGATGTGNQRSVGQALSGGQLAASDDWAGILSVMAGLNAADRAAAFDSISGEPLADMTTSLFGANDSFLTAVRDGGLGGRDDGGEALNFVDGLSFAGGRDNVADRLGDVLGAFDPSASTARGAGGWVSAYAGDQALEGKPGQARVDSRLNGFAGGYGVRNGAMSIGAAGGVSRLEGDVAARQAHYESDLSHAAAYVAFDDGAWATDVTATFYGGDLDSRRGVQVGVFQGQAIGNTHIEGQALSASVARRFQVSDNTMIALGAIGTASNASVDGFTETGAGGLSLQASGLERDWQSLQLSARATQDYRVDGRGFRIYAGAGVLATTGDRQATGDMRFTGAPTGFGAFTIEGAETPPLAGVADFGLEVGVGEGITLSAGYRGLFSERLQDNQVGVKLKASW